MECNRDALFEILMRVSHRDIFSCSLVSKDWLSVIISPIFRSHYTWKKPNPIVVDSLRYESNISPPGSHFPATSNLGRNINVRDVMPEVMSNNIGSFISESPKGDLLLFGSVDPYGSVRLHVCKSAAGSVPAQLPEPTAWDPNDDCYANIIPNDDGEYRVVLANNIAGLLRWIQIRVYCSRKGKWDELLDMWDIRLVPNEIQGRIGGGVVSNGGVIYWKALVNNIHRLAMFDVNGGTEKLIHQPPYDMDERYGTKYEFSVAYGQPWSEDMPFLAVVSCRHKSRWFGIQLWILRDNGRRQTWRLLYNVRQSEVWDENATLLAPLFKGRPHRSSGLVFVSFVPWERHSIFVAVKELVFIFKFGSRKLEYVEHLKYVGHSIENTDHSLIMLDLGDSWPSCPPSLQLSL